MTSPVYLDYNATAPIRTQVRERVYEVMGDVGNASSVHQFGRHARKLIEDAREQVAELAGVAPGQVIFNSGASESNNTVLQGFSGQRVVMSRIEHPSVLESGNEIEFIPVTEEGVVDVEALGELLTVTPPPSLVSVMMVNNETGVIQPIDEICSIAGPRGCYVHCDAVQAAGRIEMEMNETGIDYISLSAHKIGGPQGVGALIVSPEAPLARLVHGGGQERRKRAGTENIAGIVGFGLAAELARESIEDFKNLGRLRDRIEKEITAHTNRARIYGAGAHRVANTSVIGVPGLPAETQIMNLDLAGYAVSSGSACSSGTVKPSHVLQAMGVNEKEAACAIRISIGWDTDRQDIDGFIKAWKQMFDRVRDKI